MRSKMKIYSEIVLIIRSFNQECLVKPCLYAEDIHHKFKIVTKITSQGIFSTVAYFV